MTLQLQMGGWRVGRRLMVCEKKGYVEKLMMFLRQLPRLGSSDYQNCVNDMNYKIYRIK